MYHHFSLKEADLNSSLGNRCVCTHLKATSLTQSSLSVFMSQHPKQSSQSATLQCSAQSQGQIAFFLRIITPANSVWMWKRPKWRKLKVTVLFGFVFRWLPIFVVDCTDAARGERTMPRQVYLMYAFLAYLSSTINPFIYGIMNKHFRREYKVLSRKFACFRRQCRNNNKNNNSNHKAESGVWILFTILSLREFRSPPQQTDSKEEIITSSALRPKNILPRGLAF